MLPSERSHKRPCRFASVFPLATINGRAPFEQAESPADSGLPARLMADRQANISDLNLGINTPFLGIKAKCHEFVNASLSVTLLSKTSLLALFRQFLQLITLSSYLMPRQESRTSLVKVNGRSLQRRCVTQYTCSKGIDNQQIFLTF